MDMEDIIFAQKEKSDAELKNLCQCAFMALEDYAPGKKLMESLNDRLKQPIGIDCPNFDYVNGQNDVIRMLNGLIFAHRNEQV